VFARSEPFSTERVAGRCECRGHCGGHGGKRCLTFAGQGTLFGEKADVLYEVSVVRGKPKTEHHVKYVCDKCRLTFDPWRAETERRAQGAAISDHDVYLTSLLRKME
jgi:hypothetical protein